MPTQRNGICLKNFAGDKAPERDQLLWNPLVELWNKKPRSYLQAKLVKPMKKDSLYCVSFYVNLGDSRACHWRTWCYFGKQRIEQEDAASLTYEVKVPQLRTKIYSMMFSWQGVCGAYKADGFEQFLTIGNFSAE